MLNFLILIILILMSVAFITLLERKILSFMQLRVGPKKVSFLGLLQPFADAIKLMTKEFLNMYNFNIMLYFFFMSLSLYLMMNYWFFFNYKMFLNFEISMILILIISSLSVYVILGSGWSSASKYSLIGAYRNLAQVISYEVSMAFLIFVLFVNYSTLGFLKLENFKIFQLNNLYMYMFMILWLLTFLAEVNRAPFDFSESESELVSGFNTEYGGGGFAILFLSEYGNICFMSYITSIMFFYDNKIMCIIMIMIVIMIRGGYPRMRYDFLMMILWKDILPFIIITYFNLQLMFNLLNY